MFLRDLAATVSDLSEMLDPYRNYAHNYTGITSDLSNTDSLIDRILYALTDEQITIVEQRVDQSER